MPWSSSQMRIVFEVAAMPSMEGNCIRPPTFRKPQRRRLRLRRSPSFRCPRSAARPPDSPRMANEYDIVVIGSGTGGYVAAIRAAQLGLRTAVIERAPTLGGTCLNVGCIPTKALLEHAHALKIAQNWQEWGVTLGNVAIGLDLAQVHARKDKIVKSLTGGIELLFRKNKIDWIKGSGRLAGKGTVEG